ncbi:MAG: ABC transporter permease [Lachnospiraceae bacterium]|nr:ABC transporter permease [Lachnospiraceae bacterium]
MLFKLSINNIKKSMRDYAVYFFTLIVGVAVFYVFNAIHSQTVMMDISKNTMEIIELMEGMLSGVSVFVAMIMGFLIIYATRFLIKRRNREFGLYMLLGMGKRKISMILFGETFLIGLISLGVGLIFGVCISQFMSILVARLFEADMTEFQFVFSKDACIQTIAYFCLMYLVVIIFNTIMVGRYQLIDLLQSDKKTEKIRMKNPWICMIVFIISAAVLGYAYYLVTEGFTEIDAGRIYLPIVLGAVSTFFIFWSLSGLMLKVVMSIKNVYYRGLNSFVFRQFASKINTMVVSMTIICLMLFVTICVLSSALSMNHSMNTNAKELAPADIQLIKRRNLDDSWMEQGYTKKDIQNSRISLLEEYKKAGLNLEKYLGDYVQYNIYATDELTLGDTFGSKLKEVQMVYSSLTYDTAETIMSVNDYNRVASLYGNKTYSLKDDEYMIVGDFESMMNLRDQALEKGEAIEVFGHMLKPKYNSCQRGFVEMAANHVNGGIILIPDDAVDTDYIEYDGITGNYMSNDKQKTEAAFKEEIKEKTEISYVSTSRLEILENSIGLGAMVVFIGMYLGIIFLISCAAILALKELSESADNVERYDMLRKIGTDEKMILGALFQQIGIFFLFPLILACVHSYFGIRFCTMLLETFGKEKIMQSVLETAGIIVLIYGGYFLITYLCSKNMIQKNRSTH